MHATELAVLVCRGPENCFMECDASKNLYGMEYFVREPQARPLQMTLQVFQDNLLQWTTKSLFLKACPLPCI